ncbi:6-phosphogluconolactonase [Hymenobacter sp. 5317J-9]|uniref:6-phosphogluconolactonase n=1 Tax=Hymenobacter sp. 5317J-9 TaxID=2932250 RepID=UPI001FD713DA|nr:6-phosphogluconolactonase [Hymenobacter sp. 5317J-9]UOQ99040.1 6-phosphogluconolactonase [Hymenobacter sp. 5317J-9]
MQLHIHPTAERVLTDLADFFVAQAAEAIAARGRFVVALSGGSSPKKLYELLASPAYREKVAWPQVFFFFGDERNVPATDAESNYRMANEALLKPLGIAAAQVFAVDTTLPPAEAAAAYTETIRQFFGAEEARFDLVLLGLGDNSHTASLFPHTPVLHDASVGARKVFLTDKNVFRITLTAPLINQARAVAFLVYGQDKAAAVRHVLHDARDVEEFPAQLIAPAGETHWFLDQAAASLLPKQ